MFAANGSPRETPGQLRHWEPHNRYFQLGSEGPRVQKGRAPCCHAVVAWARPRACRLTRAGVRAASTRRCMRGNLGGASCCSPAPNPQRKAALPQSPDGHGGLRAPWGSGAALRSCSLPPPRLPRPAGSASRPARSSRSLAGPPPLARASHTSRLQPGVRAERPAGQRPPPWRGARGAAATPSPRGLEQPRRARAHPASSAGTPRASGPGGWRGLPGGRPLPSGSRDGGGCPHASIPAAGRWALRPRAPSGRAALPSRAVSAPAVAGGKFALPGARSTPPARQVPSRAPRPAAGAPRGQGCGRSPGARPLSPSLASSSPSAPAGAPGAYPARRPREASRRLRCILLRRRPLSPGWQARKASAASPPHAASANFPGAPGQSGSAPRAPAAALRLRSAPRPGRALPRCGSPGAPRTRALALTSPERLMSSPL